MNLVFYTGRLPSSRGYSVLAAAAEAKAAPMDPAAFSRDPRNGADV